MRNCCSRAELPDFSGDPPKTLIVTCAKLDDLANWTIRRFLGPFVSMRAPGAIPDISSSEDGLTLAKLLKEHDNIKHLVICAHSLCVHFGHTPRDNDLKELDENWRPKYKLGLLQQRWLSNTVNSLRLWAISIGRMDLEIHAWIHEPEVDWISALDQETDMFVPLDACIKLVSPCMCPAQA